MELVVFVMVLLLLLGALDLAALRWGANGRQPWTNGNTYDPRDDWNG